MLQLRQRCTHEHTLLRPRPALTGDAGLAEPGEATGIETGVRCGQPCLLSIAAPCNLSIRSADSMGPPAPICHLNGLRPTLRKCRRRGQTSGRYPTGGQDADGISLGAQLMKGPRLSARGPHHTEIGTMPLGFDTKTTKQPSLCDSGLGSPEGNAGRAATHLGSLFSLG